MMRVCVPLVGPSWQDLQAQLLAAQEFADLIELRVDRCAAFPLDEFRSQCKVPLVVAVRRAQDLATAVALRPAVIDVDVSLWNEGSMPQGDWDYVRSFHNFESSTVPPGIDCEKIAVKVADGVEALRLHKNFGGRADRIVIGMGPDGEWTRLWGPQLWSYASLSPELASAPGQLSAEQVRRYAAQSPTAMLGLIGDPVDKSRSQVTHNAVLRGLGIDMRYYRWRVPKEKVGEALALLAELPVRGLSVTMPLKEVVGPYLLNEVAGPVNTLVRRANGWEGANTDGVGALRAVEALGPVAGSKCVVIGSGGTAKALCAAFRGAGAEVVCVARNCHSVGGEPLSRLSEVLARGYDILLHATPVGMAPRVDESLVPADLLQPGTRILDAVYNPVETRLLRDAAARGCRVISGLEMFYQQAAEQFRLWCGIDPECTLRYLR